MSDRRPSRPLDRDAVNAANEAVWKEFGLPRGTQLSLDATDYAARKRWMDVYEQALKNKDADSVPQLAPSPPAEAVMQCGVCAGKTCAELWDEIERETAHITDIDDPKERNRKISAEYARLQRDNPQLKWIGLAAVVSRQAGCAMQHADHTMQDAQQRIDGNTEIMRSPWVPGDAKAGLAIDNAVAWKQLESARVAKEALGVVNKGIFGTIYPSIALYQRCGLACLNQCAYDADGTRRVPEKVLQAMERLKGGTAEDERAAADLLADYEQRDIVEREVYQVERYKDVLTDNENWSGGKRLWAGRLFGAKPAQIPLSSTCDGEEVPLKGSILNPDDRVGYYNALMDKYQSNGSAWQQQTMQEIMDQGQ